MAPHIKSIAAKSSKGGIFHGANVLKICRGKYMFGETNYQGRQYVRITNLEELKAKQDREAQEAKKKKKKEDKSSEGVPESIYVRLPLSTLKSKILPKLSEWQENMSVWQKQVEKGGRSLVKASQNFYARVEDDDNGEDDVIVQRHKFDIEGQRSAVFASLFYLRYDHDENEALQRPIPALSIFKYEGQTYQERVDFIGRLDIEELVTALSNYVKGGGDEEKTKKKKMKTTKRQIESSSSSTSSSSDEESQVSSPPPPKMKKKKLVNVSSTSSEDNSDGDVVAQWGGGSSGKNKPESSKLSKN